MSKIRPLLTGLCLVFLMVSTPGQGQLFKWVDDDGKVHYGDSPPENAELKQITGEVSSFSSVSVEPFVFDPDNITRRHNSKTVVMYSTSWCGYCKKAARYFRKKNISFTEHNIEQSASAAREYKRLNGRGVPIILIGDQRMNGFKSKVFDRIYYAKS